MKSSRCLLVITTSFPKNGDGSESAGSFVADLVEALAQYLPVRVVAPGPVDVVEIASTNLKIYRYRSPDKPLSTLQASRPWEALAIVSTLRAGMRAASLAASDGCVTYCLALWALPSGFWANHLLRKHGIPYSVWMLGSDVWSLGRIPLVRRVLARVMQKADRRFADGLLLAEDSEAICGLPVEFLPSTRNMQLRRQKPLAVGPPYRLLFLGRWHPNKGPDLLLEALAMLKELDWARIAQVDIFGGGAMASYIDGEAKRLIKAGRPITVGGFLDKKSAERVICDADYLVIPSRIESIPVVFSDALKLGCPVICNPVGDLSRIVPDWGVGFCADAVSASALCTALQRALSTPPATFVHALEVAAEKFSLHSTVCPKILSLLSDF